MTARIKITVLRFAMTILPITAYLNHSKLIELPIHGNSYYENLEVKIDSSFLEIEKKPSILKENKSKTKANTPVKVKKKKKKKPIKKEEIEHPHYIREPLLSSPSQSNPAKKSNKKNGGPIEVTLPDGTILRIEDNSEQNRFRPQKKKEQTKTPKNNEPLPSVSG